MGTLARVLLDDPNFFDRLAADMKERILVAAINTVNMQVRMTRKWAIANIQDNFTLRNRHTINQVQFTLSPNVKRLSDVQAVIGATNKAAYLKRQEFGGRRETLSGKNLAIPALEARGGNWGSPVLRENLLRNIDSMKVTGKYSKRHKFEGGASKSAGVARAAVAFRERKLLRFGNNLYFVDNFVARGGNVSFTRRQLYNFDRLYTITESSPWLFPATQKALKEGQGIFRSQMRKAGF